MHVRKDIERNGLSVLAKAGLFLQLIRGSHPAQAVHLVEHLRTGSLGRRPKVRIHATQIFGQSTELFFKCIAYRSQLLLDCDGHGSRAKPLSEIVSRRHRVRQLNLILIHHSCNSRLDESGTQTRKHWSETAQDALVEHSALSEVCNLRRPADVSHSRKQRILKHRTEQSVRTQPFRGLIEDRQQFLPGVNVSSGSPMAVGSSA